MPVAAASRKVLVLQFAKGDNLNDGLSVSPPLDGALVTVGLAEDNQMSLTLATNEQLTLLSSYLHGAQSLVRFIGVSNALGELVP